jgi:hypothetical protein
MIIQSFLKIVKESTVISPSIRGYRVGSAIGNLVSSDSISYEVVAYTRLPRSSRVH